MSQRLNKKQILVFDLGVVEIDSVESVGGEISKRRQVCKSFMRDMEHQFTARRDNDFPSRIRILNPTSWMAIIRQMQFTQRTCCWKSDKLCAHARITPLSVNEKPPNALLTGRATL